MSAEEGDTNLEDGEIEDSDVEEGAYVPLARPDNFNPPSLVHMQIQDEASDSPESLEDSSGSDSDSDRPQPPRTKRTKLRPRPRPPPPVETRKKKYDIWCTAVQEQVLTEDMVSCDVTKSRRYGVESYDYTIKYRLDDNYVRPFDETNDTSSKNTGSGNKRTHTERKNVKLRLGKRENSDQEVRGNREPRILANLAVTENDLLEDVAKDIAENLKEEKKDLLLRIVQVIGPGKAIELYQETKKVEEDGGILVMNGYRRRTAGGVYIFLLKRSPWVSTEMQQRIFHEERAQNKRERRRAHAAHRDHKVQQLKQTLNESELPALLSRAEATLVHSTEHGSNPPPSPATDARDCSSDTDTHSHTDAPPDATELLHENPHTDQKYQEHRAQAAADYDDDFLEVNCTDDMDLF